jgi:hypothetical protein
VYHCHDHLVTFDICLVRPHLKSNSNPRVTAALDRLQSASSDLSGTFDEYVRKHPDTPRLPSESLLSSFQKSSPDGPMFISGETFSEAVEQVLVSRARQKRTIANKVGQQLGRLYPLTALILGVASSAADVSVLPKPYVGQR